MLNLISTGSNYIIMIMCAVYAISCFTVFLPSSEERQVKRMDRQERFMFLFHFICYGVLFLKTFDIKIVVLYALQAVFFKLLISIYGRFYPDCSRIMMNHICFLSLIGFVMLTRLSFDKAVKQFVIVVATSFLVLFIPFFMEKAYWLKRLRWFYGLVGLVFLASVFVIGTTKNGSTNWISFGGFALQPSEFVKIAFIFFIAAMLEKPAGFRSVCVTVLFSACHVVVLILEKDLGGALLYFVIFVFMCYTATGRVIYLFGGLAGGALAGKIAYSLFSHVRTRFSAWSDPWSIIEGRGYQIAQSLFAIGTGGWFGMGLTQGRPLDIPVVESDFIFSAIAEEFGIFFAICLILIYLGVFIHFLKIAMDIQGRFYKLVAYGFSICFIFQVFLNIGGVTKFIPSTGVTLPLISYGGSSIVSTLIIFAIMQGLFVIAYKGEEENDEPTSENTEEPEKNGGDADSDNDDRNG
ncbi:MAG: FtsW/RodA/SpoVE family cell cycle protein [Eubacteriales bacterium]|nr:FtsW/RodA/SpoVE family cell cycle protein [Eubacteriales bacterium]